MPRPHAASADAADPRSSCSPGSTRSAYRTGPTRIRRSSRSPRRRRCAASLPGGHCKSLFLKDRKGGLWLVVALEERRIDLKLLADSLGAPRFSFGSAELLLEVLGVAPGSVTPFALANDTAHRVAVVLDKGMLEHDPLNYHPLVNDRTTAIAPARSAAVYRGLRPPAAHRRSRTGAAGPTG